MAAAGEIYLVVTDSTDTPTLLTAEGRKFSVSNIELSRKDRTVSGKLIKEIIAVKKRFQLNYQFIDGDDLAVYDTFFAEETELTLTVYYDASPTNYTVLMNPIDRTRILLLSPGLWGPVKIEFEEV